ncbi:neutral zinc metallopeptidase [Actinokineospora sp. NBRC 105648]|uniref:neutral zinc metallopeptidase n=1 Tax=Actinokineospora sp. NBRC 105648 TaxID=3032206 RepID=UPI0024A0EFC9|nr:neutral zinc metallopeptidase [Actinokineospora sp. NBRC 105648]GLZ38667.1 hypothetical protein Acsp05_22910 [Actinokineospora sp. NBRC 105648]
MGDFGNQPYFAAMSEVPVTLIGPPRPPRGNRPLVIVGVVGIVLVGLLWIGLLGRITSGGRVVPGVAVAVGESAAVGDPESLAEIAANKLLRPGAPLAEVDCALPKLTTDPAGLRAYYEAGIGCLDRAWQPVVVGAGLPFSSPKLNIDVKPRAKCGFTPSEDEATAFYCERDRTIYMPQDRLERDAGEETAFHLAVLAHEYGHHVQALSGILQAAGNREVLAGDEEAQQLSRRTELEANCFAGAFLAAARGRGAVSAAVADESVVSFDDTLDSDSHGSADNQGMWAERGYEDKTTAACDTWSAPAGEVS